MERQQFPIKLSWALTIQKNQGLTLPKAVIDLAKSERTPGISYVTISRVKSLSSCLIQPMTYERLQSIKSSRNLQYRLQEEQRLDLIAQQTLQFNMYTLFQFIYNKWQGWSSGESTCLPPMWPGFDFRTRRHTWIEFVGSLLCYERFSPGYSGFPLSPKTNI